jgi:Protein of unknown function (DUF983)
MLEKGTKLYAIVHQKCPRCHEGELWTNKLWFAGAKAMLTQVDYCMHENCPVCNLKYDMEPGFWWGAMYMAYAFSSGVLLFVSGLYLLFFKFNMPVFLAVLSLTALLGFLYNARLSRAAYISLWVNYDASFGKSK